MRPTKPQRSSSSPNLGAYARRQASTESACLRRLSDRVNSVSKHHASSRVIAVFSGIYWGIVAHLGLGASNLHRYFGFRASDLLTLSNVCRKVPIVPMDQWVVELVRGVTVPSSGTPKN